MSGSNGGARERIAADRTQTRREVSRPPEGPTQGRSRSRLLDLVDAELSGHTIIQGSGPSG